MDGDSRPRLAPGVRLREDRVRGGSMLLGPERGLALDGTAHAILALCSGERDVREIARVLQRIHAAPRAVVERDVLAFLHALEQRRFIVGAAGARRTA